MILERLADNRLYVPSDIERRNSAISVHRGDARDAFEKDFGRIIHSAAFRRLQTKTQVIGFDVGDLHRTRLTHSMEVAQIARGIALHLNAKHPFFQAEEKIDVSLIEAAALAHDLGHPPFGHRGEEALHACMQNYGGFEGNAHTFRILTRLEGEDSAVGLNLTRALLLAVMKYPILLEDAVNPVQYRVQGKVHPPKASAFRCDQVAFTWSSAAFTAEEKAFWMKVRTREDAHQQTVHQTLECTIIELADDIAYGTHDVEDSLNLGLIQLAQFKEFILPFRCQDRYPELQEACQQLELLDVTTAQLKYRLKKIFSAIISTLITHIEVAERQEGFSSPRLKYVASLPFDLEQLLNQCKDLVFRRVIDSQRVQTVAWRGTHVIERLFATFLNESKLLSDHDRAQIQLAQSDEERVRIVCDYIAGMTDAFAYKMYARLHGYSRNFFDD
jgi:dGTPase